MGDVLPFVRRPGRSADRVPPPRDRRSPGSHEPLWRELVGATLRAARTERGETQRAVAERAGISVQYLSEIERGRKEPSSEMVAAVAGAVGLRLLDLTQAVGARLIRSTGRPTGPVALAA